MTPPTFEHISSLFKGVDWNAVETKDVNVLTSKIAKYIGEVRRGINQVESFGIEGFSRAFWNPETVQSIVDEKADEEGEEEEEHAVRLWNDAALIHRHFFRMTQPDISTTTTPKAETSVNIKSPLGSQINLLIALMRHLSILLLFHLYLPTPSVLLTPNSNPQLVSLDHNKICNNDNQDYDKSNDVERRDKLLLIRRLTRAAKDLYAVGEIRGGVSLLEKAAELTVNVCPATSQEASSLLAFWSLRCDVALKNGNVQLARFMVGKASSFEILKHAPRRELENLFSKIYNTSRSVLAHASSDSSSKHFQLFDHQKIVGEESKRMDKETALRHAIEWFSLGVNTVKTYLEIHHPSGVSIGGRVSINGQGSNKDVVSNGNGPMERWKVGMTMGLCKAFALEGEKDPVQSMKAEKMLSDLLIVVPDEAGYRMYIKMMLARGATDIELLMSFEKTAMLLASYEDGFGPKLDRFIRDVLRLDTDKKDLKLEIFKILLSTFSKEKSFKYPSKRDELWILKPLQHLFSLLDFSDTHFLRQSFDIVLQNSPHLRFSSTASFVLQSFIWKMGDKCFSNKQWGVAVDWYLLSTGELFEEAPSERMTSLRKALLCCIEARDWTGIRKLEEMLKDSNEACTYFLKFYATLFQGDEAGAGIMLEQMVLCQDFEPNYLYWAAKLADEKGAKTVASTVFVHLIQFVKKADVLPSGVHTIVAIRCSINMLLQNLRKDQIVDPSVVLSLCEQFEIVYDQLKNGGLSDSGKETVSWFFVEAYNLCCQNSNTLPTFILDRLIEAAIQLGQLLQLEPHFSKALAWLFFFSSVSKLHSARESEDADWKVVKQRAQEARYIQEDVNAKNVLFCIVWESMGRLGEWEDCIYELQTDEHDPNVVEMLGEALLSIPTVKKETLVRLLEALLAKQLSNSAVSLSQLARWIRILITAVLDNGDKLEMQAYMRKAIECIDNNRGMAYPSDELEWMIITAWEEGIGTLDQDEKDCAKGFFEIALRLREEVGEELSSQIQDMWNSVKVDLELDDQGMSIDQEES